MYLYTSVSSFTRSIKCCINYTASETKQHVLELKCIGYFVTPPFRSCLIKGKCHPLDSSRRTVNNARKALWAGGRAVSNRGQADAVDGLDL